MLSLEYVAGFFDGEGCVNITVRGKSHQVALRAMVVNTERSILEALRLQFGGILPAPRVHRAGWKKFNMWTVTGLGAVEFLRAIRPHVWIKKPQIELALEFAEFMALPRMARCEFRGLSSKGGSITSRSADTLARELQFKERMHMLNRKGEVLQ